MATNLISLSIKRVRVRTILCFVFSIVLLLNMAGTFFTKSVVYASSMDTLCADINGDGLVDIDDLIKVTVAYGSNPEDLNWNPKADINKDGSVNLLDAVLVSNSFGMLSRAPLSLQIFGSEGTDGLTNVQKEDPYLIAENFDMYRSAYWYRTVTQQAKTINPELKCLVYRNIRTIYSWETDEWQTAVANNWILKDSSGNFVHSTIWSANYVVDIGNVEYQKWVANWIKGKIAEYGYNGVFTDCGFTASTSGEWAQVTAQPINPRTGDFWTSAEVVEAWISIHREIRRAIGSRLNIVNGIFQGQVFWDYEEIYTKLLSECEIDGFMSEGLFCSGSDAGVGGNFYSETKWKESVDFIIWVQNNFLNSSRKVFLPHARCNLNQIPVGATQQQVAMFVFSSTLLGISRSQNYLSLQGAMLSHEIQNLYKIDLGVPEGNYYLIGGTHVYARDFTKVKVLVNPTDQPYSVNLDRDYETLEGQIVSSINVDTHSGVVLECSMYTDTQSQNMPGQSCR